jgi:hypothetical protein
LYGFARPRDRWFADSPLEGPIRTLAPPHATASFASVRGCPSVIEKGSSSPGPATGLVYFSRGQSVSSNSEGVPFRFRITHPATSGEEMP